MHAIQTRPRIDGDAVEVALGDAGRAEAGRDAAAEHVGQAAATALVQQDEQGQQEARETEQHLQDDLENLHGEPFRARRRVSVPTIEYSRTRGVPWSSVASGADVLLEPDDARELVDVEARAADEGAVDVRLAHERRDVRRLHRAAVEDARRRRPHPPEQLGDERAKRRADLLGLLGRRRLAGADRPDRLVGDDDVASRRRRRRARRAAARPARRSAPCFSRSSAVSPTQITGTRPWRCAAVHLRGHDRRRSRRGTARRSEWPMITYRQSSFARNAPEISPVYAPESCAERSCAPSASGSLSAATSVCTERRSVNGGKTATSTSAEVVLRVVERPVRASARTRSTAGGRGSSSSCPR